MEQIAEKETTVISHVLSWFGFSSGCKFSIFCFVLLASMVIGFFNGGDYGMVYKLGGETNSILLCFFVGALLLGWSPILWMSFCSAETLGFLCYGIDWAAVTHSFSVTFGGACAALIVCPVCWFGMQVVAGSAISWVLCKYCEITGDENVWGWW
ncbi:MAG: hypothetical protein WC797_03920 [Candidatus Paceibacterota bacterium]